MKKILFLTTYLILQQGWAKQPMPTDFNLSCWDRTFFYNELSVESANDQLVFKSNSGDTSNYQSLITESISGSLFAVASFTIPANLCSHSETDAKMFMCQVPKIDLTLVLNTRAGNITKAVTLESAIIKLRKIQELSDFSVDTVGYELSIQNQDRIGKAINFSQKYFYGLVEDETANCSAR